MALQYDKYRFSRTPLSDNEFNKRWKDIDLRIASLESTIDSFDAAVDSLITKGLETLTTQVSAGLEELNAGVDAAQTLLSDAEDRLDVLESQFNAIINSGSLPAASIVVTATGNISSTDAQAALVELQGDIDTLNADLAALDSEVGALSGTTQVVANNTARDALTGLAVGDVVHVVDSDGSNNFQRWQITAVTDGAWSTSTKESIQIEGQVSAHTHPQTEIVGLVTALAGKAAVGHAHAISDITSLQTTLDGKASTSTTISGGGLVTGGGSLAANRTLTVTAAAASDFRTGTDDTKALTSKAIYDAAAVVSITYAASIQPNFASGNNFTVTMGGSNTTLSAPLNPKAGQSGFIRILQDGAGSRTITTWNDVWKFKDGEHPTLSTAANAVDVLFYTVYNSTTIFASLVTDMK